MALTPNTSTPPEPKGTKRHWWMRIVNYTRNDENYVVPTQVVVEKKPISKKDMRRNIKAAIIVLVVFYLMLCAFVLVNPQYALFFNNVLGVQYLTVRTTLEYTIYIVFSIVGIFLATGTLFFGYRAMTIRTKSKAKHTNIWILTTVFGIVFFSNIALFAYTYDWFRKIDFNNLDSRVLVYDNNLLKYIPQGGDISQALIPENTKIGPIQVRYDISAYVKNIARQNGLVLTQPYTFEIDYDDNGSVDRGSGSNNHIDSSIKDVDFAPVIAPEKSYDTVGSYTPKAQIRGTDVAGKPITLDLTLPTINIEKVIKISRKELSTGGIQYAFDASDLRDLGQVRWDIVGDSTISETGYQFSPEKIFTPPTVICARIFRGDTPISNDCDWRFVTEETTKSNIYDSEIQVKIDPLDPLKYQFSVDPKARQGDIVKTTWYIDGDEYVGKFVSGTEKILDYTFRRVGTYAVEVSIADSLGNTVRISTDPIFTAEIVDLKDGYELQITDDAGRDLDKESYDKATKSYLLPDVSTPGFLHLDASKIRANSSRLRLSKVEWDINNDGVYEKEGLTYDYDMQLAGRYDFRAKYTFSDLSVDGVDIPKIHIDRIAVIGVDRPIDVQVRITPDSQYAPTSVRFDASGSTVKTGDIRKFIYDFGNGKTYEGEGTVASFYYENPGEYTITVTAVTNTGERATKSFPLVIKKQNTQIEIIPSIASGLAEAGKPVTFEARTSQEGLIQWDFGDNTNVIQGSPMIHTFDAPGTYTIRVTLRAKSGVEESDTLTYTVK